MNRKLKALLKTSTNFLTRYSLLINILAVSIGFSLSYNYISQTSAALVRENSVVDAQRYLEALTAFRTLYTSEVVNAAKRNGLRITHDYKRYNNAIPLPATLSMELGKTIGKKKSNAKTFLYSKYPFPWRKEENANLFSQSFTQDAWININKKPNSPFYRFEKVDGKMSIRYATADIMRVSCVDCHNNHEQSPKRDWKKGDVRGVMEVILPLNIDQTQSKSSIQAAFIVLLVMTLVVSLVIFLFVFRMKKDTTLLKDTNEKLMIQQSEINKFNQKIITAHDELNEKTIALQESNNAKSDFLATMSHEIRTPINGVIGMLSLLTNTELNVEQQHKVKLASFSANTLLSLINDILDFSKIDANKLELENIDYDLCSLIGNIANSMIYKAQEHNIEIILDLTKLGTKPVKGDPNRLTQILTNLIGNAIKFTKKGKINIQAELEYPNNEEIVLCCSVSDSGVGIPENKLSTIFERFTQADSSTTRQFGGTGLGLAIVKKLCEMMGGDIRATSTLGKGSCFTFTIKLTPSEDDDSTDLISNIDKINVLVIENNREQNEILSCLLSNWGASVTQILNTRSALPLLTKTLNENNHSPFDLIIIDIELEEIGSVLRILSMDEKSQFDQATLIALVPFTQLDNQYCIDLGFDGYFTKPLVPTSILSAFHVTKIKQLEQASSPTNADETTETSNNQTNLVKRNILLVEDNSINQAVASCQLKNMGANVTIANNGLEALNLLREHNFDVVLMDCQMPVMDGYTATEEIRKSPESYHDIYIIAMTANAMKGDKDKCLSVGMNDYLTKPIDFELLKTKLIQLLSN